MSFSAVIFDFDGVIADSELLANIALAKCLTNIGLPTSVEDCMSDYYGTNWQETVRRIEIKFNSTLPKDFQAHLEHEHSLVSGGAAPIEGIAELLESLGGKSLAVASSSRRDVIESSLARYGIAHHFGEHIYSADGWDRGKPFPDIYFAAAEGLVVDPIDCRAIEDSPNGVRAALAAGMTVIGFCGGSHIVDKTSHSEMLRAIGVHGIAFAHSDIALLETQATY